MKNRLHLFNWVKTVWWKKFSSFFLLFLFSFLFFFIFLRWIESFSLEDFSYCPSFHSTVLALFLSLPPSLPSSYFSDTRFASHSQNFPDSSALKKRIRRTCELIFFFFHFSKFSESFSWKWKKKKKLLTSNSFVPSI